MKVEELPQEGFAECPRYITLMRFAFLTGLSDRPDLLYAWIESGDLPMRTFGTQRLVDMQKLQKRIEEAKKGPRPRPFFLSGATPLRTPRGLPRRRRQAPSAPG
ncbi:hypothetical protein [Pseudomonas aeruginosa]|uniref:hypothetical protein n=2 Tax=Pseudomonas aeruginosa TaxID=287 RepID=UPI0018730AEC|nr:hypothetical protein [Pseudomonas aeruginosa]